MVNFNILLQMFCVTKFKNFKLTHRRIFFTLASFIVKDITPTSVIVIEPNSNTENEYTMDEFQQKFDRVIYAQLN